MPKIIAIAAVTLDGKIAAYPDQISNWTSPEDSKFLRETLQTENSLVVVGMNTYKLYADKLDKRNCLVLTRSVQGFEQRKDNLMFFNSESKQPLADVVKNFSVVYVLGGSHIYGWFLKQNLLDELFITIEPLVFFKGLNLFDFGQDQEVPKDFKRAHLLSHQQLNANGTLLLHYSFK